MLWPSPSQEQTREEAFAVASIEDYLQRWPIDREEIGRDDLAWIRSLRTLRDLQEHAKKRFLHGFVGGYRLCLILERISETPDESFRNVDSQIRREFNGYSISKSTIQNTIWKEFKPVLHSWGAYVTIARQQRDYPFPCPQKELRRFLATAEALLQMGNSTRIKQSGGEILRGVDPWIVSPRVSPIRLEFRPRPI
jgi:hypothetical protein